MLGTKGIQMNKVGVGLPSQSSSKRQNRQELVELNVEGMKKECGMIYWLAIDSNTLALSTSLLPLRLCMFR